MEYAFLTQYDQKKADGSLVKEWFLIEIGQSRAIVSEDRALRDSDTPDARKGKLLQGFGTRVYVNALSNKLLSARLWLGARDDGGWGGSQARKWLETHGYRPIEEVLEALDSAGKQA